MITPLHQCSVCRKEEPWGDQWSWWGDKKPLKKFCSLSCQEEFRKTIYQPKDNANIECVECKNKADVAIRWITSDGPNIAPMCTNCGKKLWKEWGSAVDYCMPGFTIYPNPAMTEEVIQKRHEALHG